ncbi:hypothetical protein DFH08DRAFT_970764 [Mycena albidolilacea]|uniref:Uncharacterized protein n=1 Tax=Mycena albidolilacea TaxID=1033008 RepID=A0AAD6ZF70_9AGAR|nr:hypothetical protein DFH08DRAFT_970764 [Mycena albidolilacea]
MDVWICLGQHRACVRVSTVPLPSAESECSLTAATPQNSLNLTRLVFCAQPLLPLCTPALRPHHHSGSPSRVRFAYSRSISPSTADCGPPSLPTPSSDLNADVNVDTRACTSASSLLCSRGFRCRNAAGSYIP